jgi:long-chain-fatty-acid--CoA ligase ACSBG
VTRNLGRLSHHLLFRDQIPKDKMQEVAKASTGLKKMLSTWAKAKAAAHWDSKEFGAKASVRLPIMSSVLLKAVRRALGFERCYGFYVSAAPIDVKILKYFASVNIPILELFGQSECTGPHAINRLSAFKFGTVGRPLPGTTTKVDDDTGELYYTGRHIFAGYLGMPEETAATIDPEGYLHSGDVVKIDNDHDPDIPKPSGFIAITGRIKELIITAGGENVPPVLIENEIKRAMPALSNCMVIGDKRKFLTVVLCLHVEIDAESGVASRKLTGPALDVCKEIGSTATTTDEAKKDEKWKSYFDEGLKKANSKATSNAQNVGKWTLLPTDFTEKGGELTPTLKLKRSVAAKIYADEIEAMYAE